MPQGDAFPFVRMWSAPPSPGWMSQVADRPGGDWARWGLGQVGIGPGSISPGSGSFARGLEGGGWGWGG